ncbi:MAG: hypothetical protein NC541_08970 [bacterium]|nr:hypothetical protein [bacterium]
METSEILSALKNAELILVGLGEEFNDAKRLRECGEYEKGCAFLRERDCLWLSPAWGEYCSRRLGGACVEETLQKLAALLEGRNYFAVATVVDSRVALAPWKPGRIVMPCGTGLMKQCEKGCPESVADLEETDREHIEKLFTALFEGRPVSEEKYLPGSCKACGGRMILNNVYAENYAESGYEEQWRLYTKWLQGTLNRSLAVLELGVGMQFPTVIRWPFEKIVFFNRQARLIRVHEKLYQLTEELAQKGWGIAQNAIEWLRIL